MTPELEGGGRCHQRRRETMTGFGGSGRERSGGRGAGAGAFQPETRERDGGKRGGPIRCGSEKGRGPDGVGT
jgi:hypothetical protein